MGDRVGRVVPKVVVALLSPGEAGGTLGSEDQRRWPFAC
jgi:hypothetical protein